jgi:diguanylate cyclase (GGDEF)-like protein/PAS domain S-box-containing protein
VGEYFCTRVRDPMVAFRICFQETRLLNLLIDSETDLSQDSHGKYRTVVETMEDAYYEVDLFGRLVFANTALSRLLGYTLEEIIGKSNRVFMTSRAIVTVFSAFSEVYRTGVPKRNQDWEHIHKDGSLIHVEGSVQLTRDEAGAPIGFRGILRDVTARRKIEHELRESEMRFRALTNLSSDWYWEQDTEFRYTRMESRHKNLDSTQASFLGKRPWESDLEIQADGGWPEHRATLAANQPFRDVVMHRLLPGQKPYYISVSGAPIFDESGEAIGYRGVSREITDQRLAEQRIRHLATHDSLTDLPNRLMFSQMVAAALKLGQRCNHKFAVLFLDLDRFKFINDSLGHEAGDKLLQEIAIRLRDAIGGNDTIARMGGDEFVVLVRDVTDIAQVSHVAGNLLAAAGEPFMLADQECNVTASIGIAMFPANGEDEQTLMKHADVAMYLAKDQGKNNFKFYADEIEAGSHQRLTLESNLRHALKLNEFSVHYQPKLDLRSGKISGVEALLRWSSPVLGQIAPSDFIPFAEEIGLIVPIGKWVLQTACAQNVAWQRQGFAPMRMAVNLSVRQFSDENLLRDIADVLAQTGMQPELLELEITEGMVIHHPDRVLLLLLAIKEMGVQLAIDDFGTGYSSLGQLKNFPLDTLKVDRSFINDIPASAGARAIAQATIAMGKAMKLTVVAEGVETAEQADFLRLHGCDEMQGYHFSPALSADALALLLQSRLTPLKLPKLG